MPEGCQIAGHPIGQPQLRGRPLGPLRPLRRGPSAASALLPSAQRPGARDSRSVTGGGGGGTGREGIRGLGEG